MADPETRKPKPKKDSPHQMWVEGDDDLFVIANLQNRRKIDWNIHIVSHKGSPLFKAIETQLKPGFFASRLGIVLDADDVSAASWRRIGTALTKAGYHDIPESQDPNGTIIDAPHEALPRLGVWMMPDNVVDGMLEDFVIPLIPIDPIWRRACDTVDSIPDEERRFAKRHRSKACVHTWLAWQDDPGLPMGRALEREESQILLASGPLADRFLAWLSRLYE